MPATLENQGRLPTPIIEWPISARRFGDLAARWRRSGLWLTLWNLEGRPIETDDDGPRFWTALWRQGEPFREDLARIARQAIAGGQEKSSTTGAEALELGNWQPDLGICVIPVRWRKRVVGCVIAGAVMTENPGEAFTRLCDRCRLDRATMAAWAGECVALTADGLPDVVGLLALSIEQARALDQGQEEISVLTQNLENTYEELSLIYRISAQMGLPQKPSHLLQRVGHEVIGVSRASGLAFVLTEPPADSGGRDAQGPRLAPSAGATSAVEDRVVQIGSVAPQWTDIERLAGLFQWDGRTQHGYVVLNDTSVRSDLDWARPWLTHLVAVPLRQDQRLLGTMLAMNCGDGGDFTSVDVQLLRAVGDRVAAFLENQRLYDDLADLLMGLLHAVVNSVDAKDPYTFGHSERVAYFSRSLARAARRPAIECERVYLAGLLHDVGKIGVPDEILCKPGKLTREEFDALKKHPEIGVRILSPVRQTRDLLPGVLHHHERMDGRGYPHGLAGSAIPLLGRMICLADCFDAMTSNRTYRAALPVPMAISEIRRCSGTQFDPELAECFVGLDLRELFQEARVRAGSDAAISQIGALNAMMGGADLSIGSASAAGRRSAEPRG